MFNNKSNGSSRMLLAVVSTLLFLDCSFQEEIKCCRYIGDGLSCPSCSLTELDLQTFDPQQTKNIRYLDLYDNKIKKLDETSFQMFPSLTDVDLSKNLIQEISEDAFNSLTNVDLKSNLIYNLTTIHLPVATELDLGMNPITLHANSLGPSGKELKVLDLTSCNLQDFYSKTLEMCPQVTNLVLKRNQITTLNTEWFPTPSIMYLDVSYNNIRTINDNKQLPNLSELDLSFNSMTSLTSTMLGFAPNLNTLKLEGNNIRTLPDGPILAHGSLQNLSLARCSIRRLQSDSFNQLPNLRTLNLGGNVLMTVENIFNSSSWPLEKLYLSDNFLTSLNPGTLSGLPSLQELYLDGNEELQELNTSVVEGLGALRLLDVSGTRVACDCGADYWALQAWAAAKGVALDDACGEELPCDERPTTTTTMDPNTKCFDAPEMCVGERCCLSGLCSVDRKCGAAGLAAVQMTLLIILALIVLRLT